MFEVRHFCGIKFFCFPVEGLELLAVLQLWFCSGFGSRVSSLKGFALLFLIFFVPLRSLSLLKRHFFLCAVSILLLFGSCQAVEGKAVSFSFNRLFCLGESFATTFRLVFIA